MENAARRPTGTTQGQAPILGRDAELARVERLAAPGSGGVLLFVGEPGLGKTTLLEHGRELARRSGRHVLTARCARGERELPFAALHQLLLPRLDRLDRLPAPQARALGAALGLHEATAVPDRLHLAAGALTLLCDVGPSTSDGSSDSGTLAVVDDLHWADDASRDVLLFCARRLADASAGTSLLLSTRPEAPEPLPTITLSSLDPRDAARVLDLQPVPPAAAVRHDLIQHAAGNPLALVELSRADAAVPSPASSDGPWPVSGRIERAFASRLPALPAPTRWLLLLAAAADGDDLAPVLAAAGDVPDDDRLVAWAPAETAGLVHLDGPRFRFRHPLARAAVYHAAPFAERRGAHLALAEAVDDLDRRAWHRAAAAVGPDTAVATDLEATADRARERGGWAASARALERAGELSATSDEAARRFVLAAPAAMYTGRTAWVERLADRALEATDDEHTRWEADLYGGWAAASTPRHRAAVERLTTVARRAGASDPQLALAALAPAAVTAYYSGDDELIDDVARCLEALHPDETVPVTAWVRAAAAPFAPASRATLDGAVRAATHLGISELNVLGGAAWMLDETGLAARLLGELLELFSHGPTQGANALVTATLAAALHELGRWDDAQGHVEDAVRVAEATGMPVVRAAAVETAALLAAGRGRTDEARELAQHALADVGPGATRSVEVRARQALGLASLVAGEPEAAYDALRRTFAPDGRPTHRHASVHGIALLASAAARADRPERLEDAAQVLSAVTAHVGDAPGPRVAALLHHARALLASPDDAVGEYRTALADPAGATWPFERALVRLDLGERLRRLQRVSEARTELSAARETFLRIGAASFADRASAELRAAGVAVAERTPDALAQLTPQQRRIVRLAAEGRTNREIAERLFLSPRTVGFHLYRVFPLLGVTSRGQLRDLVDAGASEPRPVI
ncbi:helix-turn-helix transcriptional regulator [Isoptericola nanjingensis]|uniref:helix-turn-helix transcriptional regulator n=1 Tax=Isoptericola nanjingensis TaxID=903413 RepID=UPI003D21B8EE